MNRGRRWAVSTCRWFELEDGSLDLACRRLFRRRSDPCIGCTLLSRVLPRSGRSGQYNLTSSTNIRRLRSIALRRISMMVRREVVNAVRPARRVVLMYGEDLDPASGSRPPAGASCRRPLRPSSIASEQVLRRFSVSTPSATSTMRWAERSTGHTTPPRSRGGSTRRSSWRSQYANARSCSATTRSGTKDGSRTESVPEERAPHVTAALTALSDHADTCDPDMRGPIGRLRTSRWIASEIKRSRAESEIRVGWLKVRRDRIMDQRANALFREGATDLVSSLVANDEEVPGWRCGRDDCGQDDRIVSSAR